MLPKVFELNCIVRHGWVLCWFFLNGDGYAIFSFIRGLDALFYCFGNFFGVVYIFVF